MLYDANNLAKAGGSFIHLLVSKALVAWDLFFLVAITSICQKVDSVSPRILHAKVGKSGNFVCDAVCVYSPTAVVEHSNDVCEFYKNLTDLLHQIPISHMLLVLGDFNAQLAKSSRFPYAFNRQPNLNTDNLVEFLDEFDLLAINTIFQKRHQHRQISFYGPNHRRATLDYILIRRKWQKSVVDCSIKLSPISSDHNRVDATFKWKIKSNKMIVSEKLDYSLLRTNASIQHAVVKAALDNFKGKSYSEFAQKLRTACKTNIPLLPKARKRLPWEDSEITSFREEHHKIHLQFRSSPSSINRHLYRESCKHLSDLYLSKQELYLNNCCKEITALHEANHQSKVIWKTINNISNRRSRPNINVCADSDDILEQIWHEHFTKLLNPTSISNEPIDIPNISADPRFVGAIYNDKPFTLQELTDVVQKMQCNKASGLDELVAEVIKLDDLHPALLEILNAIYVNRSVPEEWLTAVLIPVHKKGSTSDPNNYRGIALMSVAAKVFNRLLLERLRLIIDPRLRHNQNGFRQERSTTQHVLAARRLIEEVRDSHRARLIAIFVDFSKAFDSVKWEWIEAILAAYNVPASLIAAIMSLYHGARAKVRFAPDKFTDFISLSVGVLQGDTLAPYLFVIVLDWVLSSAIVVDDLGIQLTRRIGTRTRTTKPASYLTDLDFADDIMLTSDSAAKAQSMLSAIEATALKVGLRINLSKTEFLLVGAWTEPVTISLASGSIKQVSDFKYLGSWLMDCSKDFEVRKALAWNAAIKLVKIWKNNHIKEEIKYNLFRACVESTLLYNATTWTMTKTLEKKLDGCYRRLLRYSLGLVWTDRVRNVDLALKYPMEASVFLQERRLRLAGHCFRSKQPVSQLLFWDHSLEMYDPQQVRNTKGKLVWQRQCSASAGGSGNYTKLLMRELGMEVEEIKNSMSNREEWRKRIKLVCSRKQ